MMKTTTEHTRSAKSVPTPARNAVKRRLLREIGRSYQGGDRIPSVRELSRMLSVAHNTAYEAVRELVREGVLELKPRRGMFVRAGVDLGRLQVIARESDSPVISELAAKQTTDGDGHVQGLRGGPGGRSTPRSDVLTVSVFFRLGDRFLVHMYEGVRARAEAVGIKVDARITDMTQCVTPTTSDMVVLINADFRTRVRTLPGQLVAMVTTGEERPKIDTHRVDVVSVDQVMGGRLAGEALRRADCEEAYFVGVRDYGRGGISKLRQTCLERLTGFEQGFGKRVQPAHQSGQDAYGIPHGMQAADQWRALKRPPEGIFCATDELAAGFLLRTMALGMKPGIDFQLIGFDGQSRGEALVGFPFATVLAPTREMGGRGLDLLVDRLADPDQPSRQISLACALRAGVTLRSSPPAD